MERGPVATIRAWLEEGVPMPKQESVVVLFGNPNPQMQVRQPDGTTVSVPAEHLNQSVTRVEIPVLHSEEKTELSLSTDNDRGLLGVAAILGDEYRRYSVHVYEHEQIMAVHAAGAKPDWVSSTDAGLQAALAAYFGCPVGEPVAVLTEKGRDALHEQHIGTSAQPTSFFYGALSPSKTSVSASDTTLSEEITTSEGGLLRAAMTFAHTAGTNTSTLTHTWTANSHDSLPVTLAKWANFNKSVSGGTMGEEDLLSSTATLSASGDNSTVTFTLTAG
jgi:hypothetical protein